MKTISRIENENRKRHVLVVDDEMINRMILGHILQEDFEISYAANGKAALSYIEKTFETLSIILLDLLMPEMDGFELLTILHSDPRFKAIPVIVLTSEKSAEIRSLQLGAVDFIPKPYDMPEVIRARVKRSILLAEENILLNAVKNDPLTGLFNKEFFLQYAINQDKFHPELDCDMLVLNVSRFHIVNELYGRQTGDSLLRGIADSLRFYLQQNLGLACRSHSDTFCVYIAHRTDYESLFENFLREVEVRSGLKGFSIRVGIYENCDRSLSFDQRIDHAAKACNTLRKNYRSTVAYYNKEMSEKELFCEKLIRQTDQALAEKQFQVYYQPKYNITGGTPVLTSAEALIRWKHPEHGMISPGVFIPLFEENGLIQKLDNYVWNEAARQIREWKDTLGVSIPVSVNVSRVDIFDPKLEEELLSILKRHSLDARELMLEITESAYSDNSRGLIDVISLLKEHGFLIEMDDFGSGYSSLNMLSTMPIDILKLDMGFVRKVCVTEKDRHMVEIILEIAKFLSVPVVAEGVETEEQYLTLKEMGCQVIQGYYFSRPLPAAEMTEKVRTEKLK